MIPRVLEVALEGMEDLDAAEQLALRAALSFVLEERPAVHRVAVYLHGRSQAVVRIVIGRGWVPVMLERADLRNASALADRLERALARSARSA